MIHTPSNLALRAARALTAAYAEGEANGGSIDWTDVDNAQQDAAEAVRIDTAPDLLEGRVYQTRSDERRELAKIINAMDRFRARFNGTLSDEVAALRERIKVEVETHHALVVTANGGDRMLVVEANGKVGREAVAFRRRLAKGSA